MLAQFTLCFAMSKIGAGLGHSGVGGVGGWGLCVCDMGVPVTLLTPLHCLQMPPKAQLSSALPATQACHRGQRAIRRAVLKLGVVFAYTRSSLFSPMLSLCCVKERARMNIGTTKLR